MYVVVDRRSESGRDTQPVLQDFWATIPEEPNCNSPVWHGASSDFWDNIPETPKRESNMMDAEPSDGESSYFWDNIPESPRRANPLTASDISYEPATDFLQHGLASEKRSVECDDDNSSCFDTNISEQPEDADEYTLDVYVDPDKHGSLAMKRTLGG